VRRTKAVAEHVYTENDCFGVCGNEFNNRVPKRGIAAKARNRSHEINLKKKVRRGGRAKAVDPAATSYPHPGDLANSFEEPKMPVTVF